MAVFAPRGGTSKGGGITAYQFAIHLVAQHHHMRQPLWQAKGRCGHIAHIDPIRIQPSRVQVGQTAEVCPKELGRFFDIGGGGGRGFKLQLFSGNGCVIADGGLKAFASAVGGETICHNV